MYALQFMRNVDLIKNDLIIIIFLFNVASNRETFFYLFL